MSIFNEPGGKIPIFLELRHLNRLTNVDISTFIRNSLASKSGIIKQDVFTKFMEDGRFVLIFDGFDELTDSKKLEIEVSILDWSRKYKLCGFVVSSRHDDRFKAWQNFQVFKAKPFTEKQVLELVDKVQFEKIAKKKFVQEIVKKKYQEYESFLSTPLLTLMMLMTFHQFAEVPEKKHIFYRYAFLTLYSWHDSSKESFNRESKANIVVDQFEKVFSIFCFLTYIDFQFSFDEISIRKYLEKSKKYVEFDFDTSRFLMEVLESVNLMYKDGDQFVFTHRSFQEYFSAYCLVNFLSNRMSDLVSRVRPEPDTVLQLMYEINRDVVEENYIVPTSEKFIPQLREIAKSRDHKVVHRHLETVMIFEYYVSETVTRFGLSAGKKRRQMIFGSIHTSDLFNYIVILRQFFLDEYYAMMESGKYFDNDHAMYEKVNLDLLAKQIMQTEPSLKNSVGIAYIPSKNEFWYNQDEGLPPSLDFNTDSITSKWKNSPFLSEAADELARKHSVELKAICVFILKKIEAVRLRIKNKQKSIDDIL